MGRDQTDREREAWYTTSCAYDNVVYINSMNSVSAKIKRETIHNLQMDYQVYTVHVNPCTVLEIKIKLPHYQEKCITKNP